MNFKKWVKSIQTAGYNGARTVDYMTYYLYLYEFVNLLVFIIFETYVRGNIEMGNLKGKTSCVKLTVKRGRADKSGELQNFLDASFSQRNVATTSSSNILDL